MDIFGYLNHTLGKRLLGYSGHKVRNFTVLKVIIPLFGLLLIIFMNSFFHIVVNLSIMVIAMLGLKPSNEGYGSDS